jgi:2-oxoisovalerate dehydrogenase E2 component (dihydrolipoyl transacylase)
MATALRMPQLGESVIEGTVGKWLKSEGDRVEKYEPLLEVITDKVDTEITAPATGYVLQLYAEEGETVQAGFAGGPGNRGPARRGTRARTSAGAGARTVRGSQKADSIGDAYLAGGGSHRCGA